MREMKLLTFFSSFFLLIQLLKASTEKSILEFEPKVKNNNKLIYEFSQLDIDSTELDASVDHQIIFRNIYVLSGINIPALIYYCHVRPVANNTIIKLEMCFKPKFSEPEKCYPAKTRDIDFGSRLKLQADISLNRGFKATFKIGSSKIPIDGLYFCRIRSQQQTIESNFVEIQDYQSLIKNRLDMMIPSGPAQKLNIRNQDIVQLKCGISNKKNNHISYDFPISAFIWKYCKWDCAIKDMEELQMINSAFEYTERDDGTLQIMGFKMNKLTIKLMCFSNQEYKTPYSNYVLDVKIPTKAESYNEKIRIFSNRNSSITLREGKALITRRRLTAVYRANPNPDQTSVSWSKDGERVLEHVYNINMYNLLFPAGITADMAGIYTLLVEQHSPADKVEFHFHVDVITVPQFIHKQLPSVMYRLLGQSLQLVGQVTGGATKLKLAVGSYEVNLGSKIATAQAGIESSFSREGSSLSYTLTVPNVTWSVIGKPDQSEIPTQTVHTLSVIAQTSHAQSHYSLALQLFDAPEFDSIPSNLCDGKTVYVKFIRNHRVYENRGLTVKHHWTVNNEASDKYTGGGLNITQEQAILTPKSGVNIQLAYRMEIYKIDGENTHIILDTLDDSELTKQLQYKHSCNIVSSIATIVTAITAAVILIIIAVILLVYCLTRKHGESYNIDKNERAIGLDPENECKVDETFRNYEREVDNPEWVDGTLMSHISDANDSVGYQAKGELEDSEFNVDSYSEGDSIIEEYALKH